MAEAQPRIVIMGEEVPWDEVPGGAAIELGDHFKPVKLSAKAIDEASKIVPPEHWIKAGLHSWLRARAEYVFSKMSSTQTKGAYGRLVYVFEFDADGPVLRTVTLGV